MKKGSCKHYNGSYHNDTCEVGVCYRDVTPQPDVPGSAYRQPCTSVSAESEHGLEVLKKYGPKGECSRFEEPTEEEIAEHDRQIQEHIEKFTAVFPLIAKVKSEHKGQDWKGIEECPICEGRLHMTHAAFNGHVWGRCETTDCLAWME